MVIMGLGPWQFFSLVSIQDAEVAQQGLIPGSGVPLSIVLCLHHDGIGGLLGEGKLRNLDGGEYAWI